MRALTKQDVEDLLIGAEILGCGGGGSIDWAREMVQEVYSKGKNFVVAEPSEIPVDELVFIVGRVGGGVSEEERRKVARLPRIRERPEMAAVRELSNHLGEEPYAFLASEIGAGNTMVPMYVAATTGRVAVDADACGRAKPEIAISTTHVKGISITPLAEVSPFGDVAILSKALDDYRAEDICRHMAIASGGSCGVARCPTRGSDLSGAIVDGSISRSVNVGRAIRESIESGADPVEAFTATTGGRELFRGVVRSWNREARGAFMWGNVIINGSGKYATHSLKVFFKNEFLISWVDERPYAMCPDTICIVESKTCRALSNWTNLTKYSEMEVAVLGVRADEIWRTKRGVEIFGPKHFGYNIEYIPLEECTLPE